jgi:hypothetical protein
MQPSRSIGKEGSKLIALSSFNTIHFLASLPIWNLALIVLATIKDTVPADVLLWDIADPYQWISMLDFCYLDSRH